MRSGRTCLGFAIALFGLLGRAAAAESAEAATSQLGQDLKKVLDSTIDEKTEEVVHQAQDLANKMKGNGSQEEAQGASSEGGVSGTGFSE